MSVIKMTDLILLGKRVYPCGSERTSKRRESNQRRAYPCFSADHRTGPETRRKSDGNFHLGRPTEGEYNEEFSLLPVVNYLKDKLSNPVRLVKDYLDGVDVAEGELVVWKTFASTKARRKQQKPCPKNTLHCVTCS